MALLVYLVINPEFHSRNTLATLLWPGYDQTRARAALRRTLVTLKKAGIGHWLEANRETIGLSHNENLWVDVIQFRQCLSDCLAAGNDYINSCIPLLSKAEDLYRADFMAGFTLRDSSNFDEWQFFQAENLRHDLSSALARLIRCHIKNQDFEIAIGYARRWVELDPLYELAHRQLMELYVWNGQKTAALRQFQECVRVLQQELNTFPGEKTIALYEYIQQKPVEIVSSTQTNPQPLDYSPKHPAPPQFYNFPAQSTPFLGRKSELQSIAERLQDEDCRLLSLIGSGGIGKTRLAIQAALEQVGQFRDGLYFLPLVSVSAPGFLLSTVADILGVSLDGREDATPQLLNYLRNKQMLLVIDNFEHLMSKVGLLADILRVAPWIKILVTSRERLNLQGEWAVQVKGMQYPTNNSEEAIEGYSAIALFLHRAYRVHSGFQLAESDKVHVVRICQLMEGIPLGIELAASWVHVLSCQEIATEIERMVQASSGLDFLTTTLHDVPKRHQNLHDVFEHSWGLLSSHEQDVLSELSVFQGGGHREAIEWVTQANLSLITALVDKSLLTRHPSSRYEMHQLLRQFVAEKLRQSATKAEAAKDRHSTYYLIFLERQGHHLHGSNQKQTLAEIAREIENIRAGWRWAVVQGKITQIAPALESLWFFYAMYSWFQEGIETFNRVISRLGQAVQTEQNLILHGRTLACLGWFYMRCGFYEPAKDLLEQSVQLFKQVDNQEHMATPLHYLGILAGEIGQTQQARHYLQDALTIYRQNNNRLGIAWSLSDLAYRTEKLTDAEYQESQQLLQESLSIYRTINDKQGIAIALNNLGFIKYRHGEYKIAQQFLQESLTLRREIGYPRGIAVALNNLGHITEHLKAYQQGKQYYQAALKIAFDIQTVPLALAALGGLAVSYIQEDRIELGLELLHLVLHHPASNEETKERATVTLARLEATLSTQTLETLQAKITTQFSINSHADQFERLVQRILEEA